ncbi:MAG: bifunctional nuclease family protein [Dehalococcoidia bacterium]|nr:bifunctional nuclease family protein [Dehalococcoidia bacterium]
MSKESNNPQMVEMVIDGIQPNMVKGGGVIILKERDNGRYLPIWIGSAETHAIVLKIRDITVPRPLTHDLLCSILDTLMITMDSVIVSDLKDDGTFYAKLILNTSGQRLEIDCRPSDGIAIAVRTSAPIYVEKSVLDKAGVLLDSEMGKSLSLGDKPEQEEDGNKSEQEKKSIFSDFINTLDIDDFNNNKS